MRDLNPSQELECFGVMYEPMFVQCKSRCAYRKECREKLENLFQKDGIEKVKIIQESVIAAHQVEQEKKRPDDLNPVVSPLVSEALEILASAGYNPTFRQNYISFERDGRVYFNITRYKAETTEKLIRLVHQKERSSYPDELQTMISQEKMGRDYYLILNNLSDLDWFCEKFPTEL